MQKVEPVAYASRSLSEMERRYAQKEKGMLEMVYALEIHNVNLCKVAIKRT